MIYLVLALLGLCLGSFVNALVWRIYQQENVSAKVKGSTSSKKLSILHGRSMCPNCKHELSANDLVPVLSWLELRGKCRYCHTPISRQYPLVELLTAVLFIGSYYYWPYGLETAGVVQFGLWLVILTGFMALTIYDIKWMILPDRIVYPLIGIGLLQVMALGMISSSVEPVTQAAIGIVCTSGLFYVLFQVSKGKWIGGGDVKLAVILGILVGGPLNSALLLFIASLLGCIVSIPLLISKKVKNNRIAFGPFLIIATVIVYIFGASINIWLQNILILG